MKNLSIKRVCCAIIFRDNKVLIAKRSDKKFKGLWEFPGGKVNNGESDKKCLERELKEELGIKTSTGEMFCEVKHDYHDFRIHLISYYSKIIKGEPKKIEHLELKWVDINLLHNYEFLEADKPIVKKLQN